ncbi:hypothetical protein D3C84_741020 [compost metagenome]
MGGRRDLEIHDLLQIPLRQDDISDPPSQHQQQDTRDALQITDRLVTEKGDDALSDGGQQDTEHHRACRARLAEGWPAPGRTEHVGQGNRRDEAVDAGPTDQHQELGNAGQARTLGTQRGTRHHRSAGAVAIADVGDGGPGNHHQRQPQHAVLQHEHHAQRRGHATEEPGSSVNARTEPGPDRVGEAIAAFARGYLM